MNKQTKIIATISDIRCEKDFIKSLYNEGMDIVRLNTAHMSPESASKVVENVRAVSNKIAIIVDTKGPEVRVTEVLDGGFKVKEGDKIILKGGLGKESSKECVYVNYDNIIQDIALGNSILIDDGELALKVIEKDDEKAVCEILNDGIIKSRKSVNVPDASIKLPSLTPKDLKFIQWAIDNDIDFIAHSFVRHREDVMCIKRILKEQDSRVKIIAKIENQEGVDNIDEILDDAYGVMVARGDLGIEISAEKIPGIQRQLLNKCIERKRPVIVATQMLHTMIENPRPTRAEVSDIANAVYNHTDAIMLSGETAYGKYPLEAVKTMAKIARECDKTKNRKSIAKAKINRQIPAFLAMSAVDASEQLPIKAIITDTFTGRTARYLSAFRGKNLIHAICYDDRTCRELSLSHGVYAHKMNVWQTTDEFKEHALKILLKENVIKENELVIIMGGNFNPKTGVSFIDISTPIALLTKKRTEIGE